MAVVKRIPKEILLEGELVNRVHAAGGIAEKVQVIGRRGFFDRLVVLPGGKIIFCEIKRERGGVISPHQAERHAQYKNLGATVALIDSPADIDELLRGKK